ncbi:MAG: alkaline phosphatase family protein [Planctomycetota bacterium]|jgi:predicted AlkP superfamily phosphohydrolase/phosphomutase|nr:alkaline phosphatase family protein [Planctomycetota bacterium]
MSGRFIVIGLDALDPRLCQQWMAQGHLPAMAKLASRGHFSPLATTIPCQSPVAWRSFSVGGNPGRHGIFDFLRRQPGTYLPNLATAERELAAMAVGAVSVGAGSATGLLGGLAAAASQRDMSRRLVVGGLAAGLLATVMTPLVRSWVPDELPAPRNLAAGTPFWATLGAHGRRSKVLWIPTEFPARAYPNCEVLSGLGVPDARGTNGTYVLHVATDTVTGGTMMGGERAALVPAADGTWHGRVDGPKDPFGGSAPLFIPLRITSTNQHVTLAVAGRSFVLRPGDWSAWVDCSFTASPLARVHAFTRFRLEAAGPQPVLYQSPLNFDQTSLPLTVDLSQPPDFAGELTQRYGRNKSLGWNTETWALAEEDIEADAYLEDWRQTIAGQEQILLGELDRADCDCFVAVIQATDHAQHMFWRELEQGSSEGNWDPNSVIADCYRRADDLVARVVERLAPDDHLVVCSDHGFHRWHQAVNINSWLVEQGLQSLNQASSAKQVGDLTGGGTFFEHVNWFATRAYAMGLGAIFLNKVGREPDGIVKAGEDELLLDLICDRLLAWRDPATDQPIVRSVYRGSEIYRGPYHDQAPDLIIGFYPGYRVSWQTCLGGAPPGLLAPNDGRWSGDHCSIDPAVCPGLLLSNRALSTNSAPQLIDLAPSALAHFGLAPRADMDGRALWA